MSCLKHILSLNHLKSPIASTTPLLQIVRYRGGVRPHRKPRWIPPAPSKRFVLPPTNHVPMDEVEQLLTLNYQYQDRMAATVQFLWEDYLRNSDVGQAAVLEAERAEAEHKELLAQNEKINAEIAAKRQARFQRESEEEAVRIQEFLKKAEIEKKAKIEAANKIIEAEMKEIENRIREEDLERAIETALQNPIDYEFAIDLEGHIYRGRYTKSKEVPTHEREKIPVPLSKRDRILFGGHKV